MKKLKLVVSDFHLGKGHLLADGSINSTEEFLFDSKFSEILRHYSTGEYSDADVELIINGDFLNLLQTDYLGHTNTVITESMDLHKIKSIVNGHPEVFNSMKTFAQQSNKRITYVVGNHDQGMLWPKLREYLDQVCETRINYKNIVYFFDGIHIEHGHQHEAANRINPKKFFLKQDLPEPILNLPWASHFFVNFVMPIKLQKPYFDKVRPFDIFIRWALINEFLFTVKTMLKFLWYLITFTIRRDQRRDFSIKTQLQIIKEGAVYPDLEKAAKKILNDERVHTVVFGHTHVYMYRQWGHNKEYINSGTWTELTSLDIASFGRITKLTYVLVEYPSEGGRPRARLKEWRGHYQVEMDVAI